ncbi:hypothetical protein PENTCL1PPCAC_30127, partial [Pristionchus entomophagus]
SLACMDVADCATFGASIPCDRANPTDPLGCCTVPATTAAPPVTAPSADCADLTNPSTGFSDCPARKAYCNNTVYQSLMKVQ